MTAETTDVLWLDSAQQRAWRAYLVGTTLLMDRLDRDLREQHSLSMPEYEILVRLSEAPDHRMRMAVLAGSISHSRSRVTHTVARLEKDGLVTRNACVSDGRGVEAVLTEKGLARLQDAWRLQQDLTQLLAWADTHDVELLGLSAAPTRLDDVFRAIGRMKKLRSPPTSAIFSASRSRSFALSIASYCSQPANPGQIVWRSSAGAFDSSSSIRSKPMPKPACGTVPDFRVSTYHE